MRLASDREHMLDGLHHDRAAGTIPLPAELFSMLKSRKLRCPKSPEISSSDVSPMADRCAAAMKRAILIQLASLCVTRKSAMIALMAIVLGSGVGVGVGLLMPVHRRSQLPKPIERATFSAHKGIRSSDAISNTRDTVMTLELPDVRGMTCLTAYRLVYFASVVTEPGVQYMVSPEWQHLMPKPRQSQNMQVDALATTRPVGKRIVWPTLEPTTWGMNVYAGCISDSLIDIDGNLRVEK
jgi:hypothetical protein